LDKKPPSWKDAVISANTSTDTGTDSAAARTIALSGRFELASGQAEEVAAHDTSVGTKLRCIVAVAYPRDDGRRWHCCAHEQHEEGMLCLWR
jgi:hypothetical protein